MPRLELVEQMPLAATAEAVPLQVLEPLEMAVPAEPQTLILRTRPRLAALAD